VTAFHRNSVAMIKYLIFWEEVLVQR